MQGFSPGSGLGVRTHPRLWALCEVLYVKDKSVRCTSRDDKYAQVPNILIESYGSKIGPLGIAVYAVLRKFADYETGDCYPKLSTIGSTLGISRNTVLKAIKLLSDNGIIEVASGQESGTRNEYVINRLGVQNLTGGVQNLSRGCSEFDYPNKEEVEPLNENHSINPKPLFPEDDPETIIEKEIFPYFLEQTGRSGNLYTLTPPRLKCGVARFREALKKAINNSPDNAKELMRIAIDTLAASPWHMGRDPKTNGKKYSDWADVFGTTDKFEKWLDRSE